MTIFKRRGFFRKNVILSRLKGFVGRLVALTIVAASLVFLSGIPSEQAAEARTQEKQSKLKLQSVTVADVDAESVAHLLTIPLKNLDGTESRISDNQDKIIIVNFWASWCTPCIEEMPDLEKIHQEFSGVQVIGYSVDTEQNIRRFLSKVPVSFPILIGEPTAISLMRKLGNPSGGLPFSLIFVPEQGLAYKIIGQVNTAELKAKLVEMGA